jgi:hypothetical protein
LIAAAGSALLRGSLRLPLPLKFETPFEVTLVAADGTEAVRGAAEIIEHAGHATWIRFLSAEPESPGDDSSRCMLADVDVDITGPKEAVVEPVASSSSEAFEAITAVNQRPPAFIAMGNAEPVPLLPPPPEPSVVPGAPESSALKGIPVVESAATTISDAVRAEASQAADALTADMVRPIDDRTSDVMTAPIPVETMAQVIESKPIIVEAKTEPEVIVDAKGELVDTKTDVSCGAAVAVVTEEAEAIYVNEKRDTEASPPMAIEKRDTEASPSMVIEKSDSETSSSAEPRKVSISLERGIKPIALPYVRESMPVIPQGMPSSRRVVLASMTFAAVCLAVGGAAIVWAQDAVAEAQPKPAAMIVDEPVVEQPVQTREAETMIAMPVTATPAPTTCKLDIEASVADSRVKIDGKDRGLVPASIAVACGKPVDIEVRHPRYALYRSSITVTGERQALHAKLEREKATVTLTSNPPATVTVNGIAIGKTPMTTTVARFEQTTFRFSAPGFDSDWRRIMPKSGTSAVALELKRQR